MSAPQRGELALLGGHNQAPTAQRRAALAIANEAARAGRDVVVLTATHSPDADERELAGSDVMYVNSDKSLGRAPFRLGDIRSSKLIESLDDPLVVVLQAHAWVVDHSKSLDKPQTLARVVAEMRAVARELGFGLLLVHDVSPGVADDVARVEAPELAPQAPKPLSAAVRPAPTSAPSSDAVSPHEESRVAGMTRRIGQLVRERGELSTKDLGEALKLKPDLKGSFGSLFSRALQGALASGAVVRVGRGRYAAGEESG